MPAIETEGLTRRFGEVVAVDGLDLTVERGEVFGFLGPNGAGKSTTINVLLGFLEPTAGRATVLGHDVAAESVAVREQIGVLPENFAPYERLTAREHVDYAGSLKGVDPAVEDLLERVGLDRSAWDRPAGAFSTGMEQRLALATALVGDPDLLILDEPSSGLDPEGIGEMRTLIHEEADSGTAVFFSSHILPEVEAVCDRVGILSGGSLSAVGSLDDLRADTAARLPVELTLSSVPEDLPGDLRAVDSVRSVAVEDHTIRVELDDPAGKVAVVRRADRATTVEDIVAEETSLDSLFERYAGSTGASGADNRTVSDGEVSAGSSDGEASATEASR